MYAYLCLYKLIMLIYIRTLEHPNESKIRLVLLVILGVSTLSISNLIWYIYLKCQSEKGTIISRSILTYYCT